jgi:preprotein translocase subunit SecG
MLLGILLAAVIVVCIALVGVILLQRSEGGVLGMSGGGPGNFMSVRGTGDLLTRTTQILAGIFFILCLVMTLVTGHMRRDAELTKGLKDLTLAPQSGQPASSSAAANAVPLSAAPAAPAVPAAPPSGGLDLFGPASRPAAALPPRAQAAPQAIAPAGTPGLPAAPLARPARHAARPAASAPAAAPAPESAPAAAAPEPAPAAPPPAAAPAPPVTPPANQ